MSLSLAQDAIALLIDMAERGEIDPWNVKIIDVIDRFLSELNPFEARGREPYEVNLSQSGQAFLYASMLLLLKAESLSQTDTPETDETEGLPEDGVDLLDTDALGASPLPPFLERRLRRRAVAQPFQRRRVTLNDLIEQIQTIAAALDEDNPRSRRRRPQQQSRKQAIRAIAALAHQENLSEMAIALEQFFAQHWATLTQGKGWIDFELLLELWTQIQAAQPSLKTETPDTPHSPNHDRVGIFWALLLLSAQSKVELAQEEFYADLKIQLLSDHLTSELTHLSSSIALD